MDVSQFTPEQVAAAVHQAKTALWRRGSLRFKLHGVQQKILDQLGEVSATGSKKFYLLCSRRFGKSYMLLTLAVQKCLQLPGARVLYLAPWAKDAESIVTDTAAMLLEDCPEDLRPDYKAQAREFIFRNGSVLRIKGTNGEHAQYLRGTYADLIVLDECGIMDDLKHVVSDVCMPMTLTRPGAMVLFATTPPRSPGHESATIYEDMASKGSVAHYTIREDIPHLPLEAKCQALIEAGEDPNRVADILMGVAEPQTTTAKREYFCEFVTDASSAVVPEYTPDRRKEIVRPHDRPAYFDRYVSMDPGMKDRTGILFGYWDFASAKLIIEDEALLQGPNTLKIAETLRAKETALWPGQPIYRRISDVDLRLIADLHMMHDLHFVKALKEDSLGAINLMRNMILNRQIVIDPRCVNLDRQLRNAIWNKKATDFARGEEGSIDGHYDLVAALKYLCRMIDRHHNPFPDSWFAIGGPGGHPHGTWISPKSRQNRKLGLYSDTPFSRRLLKSRASRVFKVKP